MKTLLPILTIIIALAACGGETECPTKTCDDFTLESRAQETYLSDTICYANLDINQNGLACEDLP